MLLWPGRGNPRLNHQPRPRLSTVLRFQDFVLARREQKILPGWRGHQTTEIAARQGLFIGAQRPVQSTVDTSKHSAVTPFINAGGVKPVAGPGNLRQAVVDESAIVTRKSRSEERRVGERA